MEWSSRCSGVSHRREAILLSFPVGRPPPKEGRKNPLHIEGTRERETDKGSEGKCGR